MIANQGDEQEATPQTIQIGIELENETNDEITLDVQDIKKETEIERPIEIETTAIHTDKLDDAAHQPKKTNNPFKKLKLQIKNPLKERRGPVNPTKTAPVDPSPKCADNPNSSVSSPVSSDSSTANNSDKSTADINPSVDTTDTNSNSGGNVLTRMLSIQNDGVATAPVASAVIDSSNRGTTESDEVLLNGYNYKKTLANGLMDFAFLTANANQLHYAVEAHKESGDKENGLAIILISISICFQFFTGCLLIVKSYVQSRPLNDLASNMNPELLQAKKLARQRRLIVMDHITIAFVFIIAIVNIFIASLGTGTGSSVGAQCSPSSPEFPNPA